MTKQIKKVNDLHLKSILCDLILYDDKIEISKPVNIIRSTFENNPALPGIILTKEKKYFGFISRKQYHESLSKPFWLDLFSKREIVVFFEQIEKEEILKLPFSMDISTAVQIALSREKDNFDGPIIVEFDDGSLKILDSYFLILAHSQINLLAMQALKEANDSKTELLSIAAHDLKNPLNNIIALSKIALEEIDSKQNTCENLEQIFITSSQMLNLIVEILNTNVIEAGKIQLKKQYLDLIELINVIIYQSKSQTENKQQKIEFNYNRSKDYIIYADPIKIRESIENLVSNAIKYSKIGGYININVDNIYEKIQISVKDSGPGISKDDMKKLFNKFQRLSALPTAGESSTGLGLYIAKQIIELHNGNIWAESKNGDGSTFFIEIKAEDLN